MDYKKLMFAVRLPVWGLEWYSRSFADAQDDKSGCVQDDKRETLFRMTKAAAFRRQRGDENRDGGR